MLSYFAQSSISQLKNVVRILCYRQNIYTIVKVLNKNTSVLHLKQYFSDISPSAFKRIPLNELQTNSLESKNPETDTKRETVFPLYWIFRMLMHFPQFIRTKDPLLVSFTLAEKSFSCLRAMYFSLIYFRHHQANCRLRLLPKHFRIADSDISFVSFIPKLSNFICYTIMERVRLTIVRIWSYFTF